MKRKGCIRREGLLGQEESGISLIVGEVGTRETDGDERLGELGSDSELIELPVRGVEV